MLTIEVLNQISNSSGPRKISLVIPGSTKIGELKDQIGSNLMEERVGSELCVLYKGKDLTDDLKTCRDIGMKPQMDARDPPTKLMLSLKSSFYVF